MAYRFFAGVASNNSVGPESPGSSGRGAPRFQANWFKNFITTGAKPSSSELENHSEEVLGQQQQHVTGTPLRQNSRQNS